MTPPNMLQVIRQELEQCLAPQLVSLLDQRDAAKLVQELPRVYSSSDVSIPQPAQGGAQRAWELCGLYFLNQGRLNDALPLFERLYLHMLEWQDLTVKRCHKGMPLVWIAECHSRLGHPAIARRFLMLTLCEDAIAMNGFIPADRSGVYFRLVWNEGIPDSAVQNYAKRAYQTWAKKKKNGRYPEWVLQELGSEWQHLNPSTSETTIFTANPKYIAYLVGGLVISLAKLWNVFLSIFFR